jgi:hypothetical protein
MSETNHRAKPTHAARRTGRAIGVRSCGRGSADGDAELAARAARRRAADARRARASRSRRRAGRICVTVEVGHEAIALLCKHGFLSESATGAAEIARALARFVAEAAAE